MLGWALIHASFRALVQTLNIDNRWKSHSWKGTSWEITPGPRRSVKHENNSYLKLKWCVVHYGGNSRSAGQSHVRQPHSGTKSPLSNAASDPLKVKSCWQAGAMLSDVTFAIWDGDWNGVSNKQWQSILHVESCSWRGKGWREERMGTDTAMCFNRGGIAEHLFSLSTSVALWAQLDRTWHQSINFLRLLSLIPSPFCLCFSLHFFKPL